MKRLCTILAVVIVLAGCATQSQSRHPTQNQQTSDGTVVDYAGVPCGNQNMHVKSPVCLFPRTLHASGTRDVGFHTYEIADREDEVDCAHGQWQFRPAGAFCQRVLA
jgi:hypothetical protein